MFRVFFLVEALLGRPDLEQGGGLLRRSPTLTALQVPDGLQPEAIRTRLRDAGVQIAVGLGSYKPTCVRIGHMGDIRMEDVDGTMDLLEQACSR